MVHSENTTNVLSCFDFAVLDSAVDQRVADLAMKFRAQSEILFDGRAAHEMREFAPYVFECRRNFALRKEVLSLGWGSSLGILLRSSQSLRDVRLHLRKLYVVELPDGRKVCFRYFDPRVFRPFIESSDPVQQAQIFSEDIEAVICEGERGSLAHVFSLAGGALRRTEFKVDQTQLYWL